MESKETHIEFVPIKCNSSNAFRCQNKGTLCVYCNHNINRLEVKDYEKYGLTWYELEDIAP